MEQKVKLRQELLKKRASLSREEVSVLSQKITDNCIESFIWENIDNLHIYQPITKNNEVDTSYLINYLNDNFPKTKIYSPDQDEKNPKISKIYWGLVIVPTLGFDSNCNRLGYGGGYYDQFIAENNIDMTIGLGYSFCEIDNLPTEPHDQKLKMIITDEKIFKS